MVAKRMTSYETKRKYKEIVNLPDVDLFRKLAGSSTTPGSSFPFLLGNCNPLNLTLSTRFTVTARKRRESTVNKLIYFYSTLFLHFMLHECHVKRICIEQEVIELLVFAMGGL